MVDIFEQPQHIQLIAYGDNRGVFFETYSQTKLSESGIKNHFVQDNFSFSRFKNTVRGLHFQTHPRCQSKLVTCLSGKILDVIVDLRKDAPTYLSISKFILDSETPSIVYVPQGFAHGFCTLTDNTMVLYKVDDFYSQCDDGGIRFDDADLNIDWRLDGDPILSDKDARLPYLSDLNLKF